MAGVAMPWSAGSQPERAVPRHMRSMRDRVDAAAVGHAVLAVARDDEVVGAQRPGRAHLGRLLPAAAVPTDPARLGAAGPSPRRRGGARPPCRGRGRAAARRRRRPPGPNTGSPPSAGRPPRSAGRGRRTPSTRRLSASGTRTCAVATRTPSSSRARTTGIRPRSAPFGAGKRSQITASDTIVTALARHTTQSGCVRLAKTWGVETPRRTSAQDALRRAAGLAGRAAWRPSSPSWPARPGGRVPAWRPRRLAASPWSAGSMRSRRGQPPRCWR